MAILHLSDADVKLREALSVALACEHVLTGPAWHCRDCNRKFCVECGAMDTTFNDVNTCRPRHDCAP